MTDERLAVFAALRRVVEASERHAERLADVLGVHRSDAAALIHVHQAEVVGVSVRAGDVARAARLSRPATSALLTRLEGSGHLIRTPDPHDARQVTVHLTDRGRLVLAGPLDRLLEGMAEVLDRHPLEALRAAATLLDEVARVVEDAGSDLTADR